MSLEIMKKSVDFLMKHSTNSTKVDIGFYGGEPLLEFDNIKRLIEYIEERYPYKSISYSMTTNGTLFNQENIKFLIKKNINVMISLDEFIGNYIILIEFLLMVRVHLIK